MSTDLRAALRDAVAAPPPDPTDLRSVVEQGARRVRRRQRLVVAASALATTAAVLIALVVLPGPGRKESVPPPANVVHLDLDDAQPVELDVLRTHAQTRDAKDDFSYDRYEGLTPDGLVLRARFTWSDGARDFGLVNPATGRVDWLPAPPGPLSEPEPVESQGDRIVLVDRQRQSVLTFDRTARSWTRVTIRIPAGLEVHYPPQLRGQPRRPALPRPCPREQGRPDPVVVLLVDGGRGASSRTRAHRIGPRLGGRSPRDGRHLRSRRRGLRPAEATGDTQPAAARMSGSRAPVVSDRRVGR